MKKNKTKNHLNEPQINITQLPAEILLYCFSYLKSAKDLASLAKTNHILRKVALDSSLWKAYTYKLLFPRITKQVIKKKRDRQNFMGLAELTNGFLAVGLPWIIYILDPIQFKRVNIGIAAPRNNTISALPDNHLAVGCNDSRIWIWKIYFSKEEKTQSKFIKILRKKDKIDIKWYRTKIIKAQDCKSPRRCGGIKALATTTNGYLASGGCCGGTISIWDTKSGGLVKILREHKQKITALVALPDNKLASGSGDRRHQYDPIRIWNLKTGECIHKLEMYYKYSTTLRGFNSNAIGNVNALLAVDDEHLVVARNENNIRIWNTKNCKFVKTIHVNASKLAALPHGQLVIYNTNDSGSVTFWDVRRNKRIYHIRFGKEKIKDTTYSNIIALRDGTLVCGKARDGLFVFKFPPIPENFLQQQSTQNQPCVNSILI